MKTILQTEESIQDALESLRSATVNSKLSAILDVLAPKGYRLIVELQEDGRKKRRTASIENWNPENGEILISFSKDESNKEARHGRPIRQTANQYTARTSDSMLPADSSPARAGSREIASVKELCATLEEVERQGLPFVALKRFRDNVLPSKGFSWAASPESRQEVLAQAIESGAVVTSKIPNPRSPFPTTTIRLNRSRMGPDSRRFAPVRVQGEALSATILRDRGAR